MVGFCVTQNGGTTDVRANSVLNPKMAPSSATNRVPSCALAAANQLFGNWLTAPFGREAECKLIGYLRSHLKNPLAAEHRHVWVELLGWTAELVQRSCPHCGVSANHKKIAQGGGVTMRYSGAGGQDNVLRHGISVCVVCHPQELHCIT